MPKVSVIVPAYNAEKAIGRCLDSILGQDFSDFELIVIDDGSTDATPSILDGYAARDGRVRVVHKANAGVSTARNDALDLARGDYVQFLDADDWITQDATTLLVRTMEEGAADMVIADFYRVVGERVARKGDIDEDGPLTREQYADLMMQAPADYYYGVLWNKLFRRSLIERHHLRMDPDISWSEDFIFNMEYVLRCDRIVPLRTPVYYYVKTQGSLVESNSSLAGTVRMKLSVIEYYRQFYRNVYDDEGYRARSLWLNAFLFDVAGDGGAMPLAPGTVRLGSELGEACVSGELEGPLPVLRYAGLLLDRYLERAASGYRLDVRDIKALLAIDGLSRGQVALPGHRASGRKEAAAPSHAARDAADAVPDVVGILASLLGVSRHLVWTSAARLVAAGLVAGVSPLGLSSVRPTPKAQGPLAAAKAAVRDFEAACAQGLDDASAEALHRCLPHVLSNVRSRLAG